jgi:hypothetical protein
MGAVAVPGATARLLTATMHPGTLGVAVTEIALVPCGSAALYSNTVGLNFGVNSPFDTVSALRDTSGGGPGGACAIEYITVYVSVVLPSVAVTTTATGVGLDVDSLMLEDGCPGAAATLLTASIAPWSVGNAVTVTEETPRAATALYSTVRLSKVGVSAPEDIFSDDSVASCACGSGGGGGGGGGAGGGLGGIAMMIV